MFSSFLVLGKQCLITSSSSSVALCHLRKREQKEILAFRASLMGILIWVDIRPDLGQWRVEETFPQARCCTWGALKPTSTAARTGGDISAVLLGAWLTAGQLTKGAVCLRWLWTFSVDHWWLWLLARVYRLHTVHQQILRLCRWRWRDHINQMREETVAWLFT